MFSKMEKGKLKVLKLPVLTKIFKKSILEADKDWDKHSPMKIVGEYMKEILN